MEWSQNVKSGHIGAELGLEESMRKKGVNKILRSWGLEWHVEGWTTSDKTALWEQQGSLHRETTAWAE